MINVLFVCLGNICRSPLGEGVFKHLVEKENLQNDFFIDSCGTSAHHIGELADKRMRKTAATHGITLTSRARQIEVTDLDLFDYIIAMDTDNIKNILQIKNSTHNSQIVLMRDFDLQETGQNVPDPYYGGIKGFENVYQIILRSSAQLLKHIKNEQNLIAN